MAVGRSQVRGSWALLLALAAGAAGCGDAPAPGSGAPTAGDAPHTVLRGVVLEGYAAASHKFRVQAREAEVDPIAGLARLEQVSIEFSDRQSGPVAVTAGEGEFRLDRDDFALRGGVVGETGAGEHFETEDLRYDDATRSLRTESPVRVTRSSLELRGRGMRFDVDSRRLRFLGRVSATGRPSEGS